MLETMQIDVTNRERYIITKVANSKDKYQIEFSDPENDEYLAMTIMDDKELRESFVNYHCIDDVENFIKRTKDVPNES